MGFLTVLFIVLLISFGPLIEILLIQRYNTNLGTRTDNIYIYSIIACFLIAILFFITINLTYNDTYINFKYLLIILFFLSFLLFITSLLFVSIDNYDTWENILLILFLMSIIICTLCLVIFASCYIIIYKNIRSTDNSIIMKSLVQLTMVVFFFNLYITVLYGVATADVFFLASQIIQNWIALVILIDIIIIYILFTCITKVIKKIED
uniref:Uncharacterized protein n=1 Tax=viral metagenome TaxID=1070528 RepID=A0A6C0DHN4_9ZZZZ